MMSFTDLASSAAQSTADVTSGFSWGTLLMFVGGALLLAFVCSIGFIARLRDRKLQKEKELRQAASSSAPTPPSANWATELRGSTPPES